MSLAPTADYVMGHTDHERRRLELQARILKPYTERFLQSAGISAGMRVLDLGCGVGDVSIIAGTLVGPYGQVTGIDLDKESLTIAADRAKDCSLDQVQFSEANLADFHPSEPFDAVIGRHILIHAADPQKTLRSVLEMVRPGGLVAFQEYDLKFRIPSCPHAPLQEKLVDAIFELFGRAVPGADAGARLFQWFVEAGTDWPEVQADLLIDGGPDSPYYEWLTETVRSLLPRFEALGLLTASEVDLNALEGQLRAEALSVNGPMTVGLMYGAFARKPLNQ